MKKVVSVATLLVAALALGGCASSDVAARVGDATISSEDVEVLTEVECTLAGTVGQVGSAQPVRQRRVTALNQLIDLEILRIAAEEGGGDYDESSYAAELDRMRADMTALPEETREPAEELYAAYIKAILQLREVSERSLAAQGVTEPEQAQLEQELQAQYAKAREGVEIEVNPAYGPDELGRPGGGDGSLSVAVSEYARQATSAQPDAGYVSELPPRMLCG